PIDQLLERTMNFLSGKDALNADDECRTGFELHWGHYNQAFGETNDNMLGKLDQSRQKIFALLSHSAGQCGPSHLTDWTQTVGNEVYRLGLSNPLEALRVLETEARAIRAMNPPVQTLAKLLALYPQHLKY